MFRQLFFIFHFFGKSENKGPIARALRGTVKDFKPKTDAEKNAKGPIHAAEWVLPRGVSLLLCIFGPSETRFTGLFSAHIV